MNKFSSYIERNIQAIITITTVLLLFIGIFNIIGTFKYRGSSNDECLWVYKTVNDSTIIVFDKVKVNGVVYQAGIRNGDVLLAINGVKAKNTIKMQMVLNQVDLGKYASYTFMHNGKIKYGSVSVKKLIPFNILAFVFLGIIWLIVGFVVVLAKPNGKVQQVFYSIGALYIFQVTYLYLLSPPKIVVEYFIDFISVAANLYLPFLFVHFFWIFPRTFNFYKKKWPQRIVLIAPIILIITIYIIRALYFFYWTKNIHALAIYDGIVQFLNILTTGCILLGLISLFINYLKIKNKQERKPLSLILFAFTLGILSVIYVAFIAPLISDTVFNSPEFYMPVILVVLVPISFGISILKYQLMDVSVVVKNTIVYGAATLTLAVLYFLIIYLLGISISSVVGTEYRGIIAGIVFIIFAVVFQSTKDKFQDFITEKFYPEQFAYQKVLVKFSNDVATVVGYNKILDEMKKTFIESLMIKEFGILLRDEKNNFKLLRSEGIDNKRLVISSNYLKDFLREKELVQKNPVIESEDFIKVFPEDYLVLQDEKIYTIIPMIIKSEAIGLLLFGLKHSGSHFSGKDLDLLYAAANQCAVAIENARLYKSEAEKLKIERELDLARKIQQGLLPNCIPVIKNLEICGQMIPAMQVGGDYFDLIRVSPTKLFVIVGDVSGKGLSAALYMTKLQTIMQLSCIDGKTPKEILIDVNKKMYEAMEKSWFITLTLALFDMEKQTVSFCRAGHMPILVANNGSVESFRTQGIGIGLEKGEIFASTLNEEEKPLREGEIYAFFSDGITEAMDKKGNMFGEEKLKKLLLGRKNTNSDIIMNELWEEIEKFKKDAKQNDDMTLVLVKVKENLV